MPRVEYLTPQAREELVHRLRGIREPVDPTGVNVYEVVAVTMVEVVAAEGFIHHI